jgi:hypothetical protein
VVPVALALAQVTAEAFLPILPRAIVKVVQALILPNCRQVRVIHMVALDQILVTLHLTTAGDSNDPNLKAWVLVLGVLEWVLIVVPAEHQITADNPLALIPHEPNQ